MPACAQVATNQTINWDAYYFDDDEITFSIGPKRLRSIDSPAYLSTGHVFDKLCLGGEPFACLKQIIGEAIACEVTDLSASLVTQNNLDGDSLPGIQIQLIRSLADGEELQNHFTHGAADRVAAQLCKRLSVCEVGYSSSSE